jgi:KDO2-lipid IV(A) lauroyltransferase
MRGFPGGERISIEGRDHLDEALRAGRGAIIVTPHFGYARLLKPILVSHGFRALLIGPADDVGIPGFSPLTRVGRLVRKGVLRLPWPEPEDEIWMRAAGYDLVAELNLRPHLAALAQNEILITLPEGRGGLTLHRVSMMGIDVLMSPAVLSVARHTAAAVLPAFVEDDAGSTAPLRVRLVIERPLALSTNNGGRTSMAADLQSLANVFESWIRASPHLWLAWSGPPLAWWGRTPSGGGSRR